MILVTLYFGVYKLKKKDRFSKTKENFRGKTMTSKKYENKRIKKKSLSRTDSR